MKNIGGPVVIGGDNLPSPVRIGLTDLQNIEGASGTPVPASLKVKISQNFVAFSEYMNFNQSTYSERKKRSEKEKSDRCIMNA